MTRQANSYRLHFLNYQLTQGTGEEDRGNAASATPFQVGSPQVEKLEGDQ